MTFVATLNPPRLWKHFDKILTIPRGSKEEGPMRDYVLAVAASMGLDHSQDAAGNVVVRKPAVPGRERAATVILQAHLDMVNEKNSDVVHDFSRDPIQPRLDGEYLSASGTTLGSDNGIGVAAMLALMEADDVAHGPLELLFTIDEETGLTGASNLDPALLTGRILINLDSEEENTVTVGCAGGAGTTLRLPVDVEDESGNGVRVQLRNLRGGHSGLDIHLQRGNAVKLLARILNAARVQTAFQLSTITGGNKHNAIPREAEAVVKCADVAAFRTAVDAEFAAIRMEYASADPEMKIAIEENVALDGVWSAASTAKVLALLEALPHGVLAMSADIAGLVETSTNVATVAVRESVVVVGTSSRSSVGSALVATQRRIAAMGSLAGAKVDAAHGYPGWKPDLTSPVLKLFQKLHVAEQGREAEVVALHAGLECGIIGEKIPGMDMISFGPTIESPHSPQERVLVASVDRFFGLLTALLRAL